jgi:hypothetical protein
MIGVCYMPPGSGAWDESHSRILLAQALSCVRFGDGAEKKVRRPPAARAGGDHIATPPADAMARAAEKKTASGSLISVDRAHPRVGGLSGLVLCGLI